ncbi:MAG: insulinase family protein [Lachnospiraceae bacterium]
MSFEQLEAYQVLQEQELPDIHASGTLFVHKKSGARVAVISNEDENKVFSIGFRTPPSNSYGTPHIIEHTVLCGSDKFPAKDPFIELLKGSMNTFLNAITYPDKTIFPIASCNDKDFQNLMDVYMDAVFHPNIYRYEEIFKQEGWHYELESKDAPLTINGVVYNEMKGAYSSPEELLGREINQLLFPDSPYSHDSGGDPDQIPNLTYEQFLEFHRRYYHPCNSYIYLYGNMDVAEKLEWLDREYLSDYEKIELDSTIHKQKPFDKPVEGKCYYPISSEESEQDNTYLLYETVIGTSLEKETVLAMQILDYALLSSPGAPVRQALLDAGIGTDICGGYEGSMYQPNFYIEAENANPNQKDEFVRVVRETLENQVKNGLEKDALLAAINSMEFKFREADYGRIPKGLMYGIQCMESWLYDDAQPFTYMQVLDLFPFFREQVEKGYFEALIQEKILDNPFTAIFVMEPKKGLNAQKEQEQKEKLAAYKATLSDAELEELIAQTKALRQYQEEPTPQEILEKIPMLTREDMKQTTDPVSNIEKEMDGVPVLWHDVETNGIQYLNLMFHCENLTQEELPYIGLLRQLLTYVDTDEHSYGALNHLIDLQTGGIFSTYDSFINVNDQSYRLYFEVQAKMLYDQIPVALPLMKEVICQSKFADKKRLREVVSEVKSRLQDGISSSGNKHAMIRAMSYFSETSKIDDSALGIGFYFFLKDLDENFDARYETVVQTLQSLVHRIFRKENLLISVTTRKEGYEILEQQIQTVTEHLFTDEVEKKKLEIVCEKANEGFKDASQIQYVAVAGDYLKKGFEFQPYLRILRVILNYDYLWNNIRVKGGAYGCGATFNRFGEMQASSYRDPHLKETKEVFEKMPEYIRQFEANERDMTKYIIGTFSEIDVPRTPSSKGTQAEVVYLSQITQEMRQKDRERMLQATPQDIRDLADLVEAALSDDYICVIGNEKKIEEEKELFLNIQSL